MFVEKLCRLKKQFYSNQLFRFPQDLLFFTQRPHPSPLPNGEGVRSALSTYKCSKANIPCNGEMLHRKELIRSPIEQSIVLLEFVDGLLTRQLFDSLVFVFVPAGTFVQSVIL
jgi:hypothetical protein